MKGKCECIRIKSCTIMWGISKPIIHEKNFKLP